MTSAHSEDSMLVVIIVVPLCLASAAAEEGSWVER